MLPAWAGMAEGVGGTGMNSPPDFVRSENGGGSTDALHDYLSTQIFKPSAIPAEHWGDVSKPILEWVIALLL